MSTPKTRPASPSLERATADRLAAHLRAIEGVAGLHPGRYGEVALLYPRHRIPGLRHTRGSIEVHLVVDLAARRPLIDIAAEVREVFKQELVDAAQPLHVVFADATGDTP